MEHVFNGRGSRYGVLVASMQLFCLLFADDVILFDEELTKLHRTFDLFQEFCAKNGLKVNEGKTKVMTNRCAGRSLGSDSHLKFGKFSFEIVSTFKYLGTVFDGNASEKTMVQGNIAKGRKAFGWLHGFVKQNGWTHPHMRMVLLDVYVRSVLAFGCPIWGPKLVK